MIKKVFFMLMLGITISYRCSAMEPTITHQELMAQKIPSADCVKHAYQECFVAITTFIGERYDLTPHNKFTYAYIGTIPAFGSTDKKGNLRIARLLKTNTWPTAWELTNECIKRNKIRLRPVTLEEIDLMICAIGSDAAKFEHTSKEAILKLLGETKEVMLRQKS